MISVVTYVVNLLATFTQCFFISASILGEIIVTILTTIFSSVIRSAKTIFLFFRIVYEDNFNIFTEDIPNLTAEFLESVVEHWFQIQKYFSLLCSDIVNNLILIIGTVRWSIEEVLLITTEIVLLCKKTLIFLGETSWFVLTFIPIQLPQLLGEIGKNIRHGLYFCALEAYMSLLRFTNFLTDVPLESFVGLLLTMIIVRLCIHFRDALRSQTSVLYWILIRKVLYVYYLIYNYFNDYDTRLISRMVGGQQLVTREDDMVIAEDISDGADTLCVICQERPKCVLTLPCRHVCLCSECCMRLYGYQRTCPICRTFIYHSVTVYL